ncbi:hypothetical protein T265_06589 [Opisthorchis viverrini]|uniref:Uncharacterized protein n=1 Tax=Opisthorchis viverrini TaxID=6198 RepID=A0A075ADK6_OPIVI|nr:hypothetical protein T265_06589 [Opisthorchis viverrini]KER26109.1 hypothetical protein T265_06589 [Opisthorchis viverrini]
MSGATDKIQTTTTVTTGTEHTTQEPTEATTQKTIEINVTRPGTSLQTSTSMEVYSNSPIHSTYSAESEENSKWSTLEKSQFVSSADMQYEIPTVPSTQSASFTRNRTKDRNIETSPNIELYSTNPNDITREGEAVENSLGTTPQNSHSPSFSDIQNKTYTVPYKENMTFAQTTTSMIISQTLPNMEGKTVTTHKFANINHHGRLFKHPNPYYVHA